MNKELLKLINDFKKDERLRSLSEEATKQAVILRILNVLGWDTFNIDEVCPEYSLGGRRVDYALRYKGKNKVFIEVKKVNEDLEKHQEQLLNYAFQEGVRLAILTNGISWWFYLPLREGSWEQRKFYTIEIYEQGSEDITKKFEEFLSKENVISDRAIENAERIYESKQRQHLIEETLPKAWKKIITEPDELLVELLAETTEKLCGYKPDNEMVKQFLKELAQSPQEKIIPSERQEIRTRNIFAKTTNKIEIILHNLHTPKRYALIPIPKEYRRFFPGYKVPFLLETDIGEIRTKVTSAPKGTEYGDPDAGNYIQGGLKPWYNKHRDLKEGDKLIIEVIEPKKRYRLYVEKR